MSPQPPPPPTGTPNPMVSFGWANIVLAQQTTKHDWFEELSAITATVQFFTNAGQQYTPSSLAWRLVNPGISDLTNWTDITASLNLVIEPNVLAGTVAQATRVTVPGYPLQNPSGIPEQREILFQITDSTLPAGNFFYARKLFTVFRQDFLNDKD